MIIARAVPAEGRSRAWVDGRMSPVSALTETASELVEIHGQHAHQSLVTPAAQRAVLDAYAGTDMETVLALRARLREIAASVAALGGDVQARAREADVLRYQVAEIAGAHLSDPEEDGLLRQQETRLADATAHREAAGRRLGAPRVGLGQRRRRGAGPPGRGVGAAGRPGGLRRVPGADHGLGHRSLRRRPGPARRGGGMGGRSRTSGRRAGAPAPPGRSAPQVRRRPGGGDGLRRPGRRPPRRARERRDQGRALEATRAELAGELDVAEAKVRAVRTKAAKKFGALVGERLADLAMPGARVEIRVAPEGTGEPVEIALGANVGEAVLPLAKAASGGELARAMLAVRLVAMGGPQTMVFDEVDAGVGGAAALSLGSALHEVSRTRQVLVVTHLAQVAAKADRQIAVHKDEVDGRTLTSARPVEDEERVVELSRMLSGHPDSDAARAHARELLGV